MFEGVPGSRGGRRREASERARAQARGGEREAGRRFRARPARPNARAHRSRRARRWPRCGTRRRRRSTCRQRRSPCTWSERREGAGACAERVRRPRHLSSPGARVRTSASERAREHAPARAVAGRRGRDDERRRVGVHDALHRRSRGARAHRALRGQVALVEGELRVRRGLGAGGWAGRGARLVSGRCLGGSARARRSAAHVQRRRARSGRSGSTARATTCSGTWERRARPR